MSSPRTVFVTGANSGIGHAIAELLAERGYRVLAGTRRPLDGADAVSKRTSAGGSIESVQIDVTNEEQLAAIVRHLDATCPDGLYALVNNAGLGPPSATELTDVDELRQILEVNTIAPLRIIQACLPALRRRRGRIVNMSSMNGTLVLPMVGAYSASKFALEAISDALRIELMPWGIAVSVIRPGQVATPIFEKAREALSIRSQQIPPELAGGYDAFYARTAEFNERGANSPTKPEAVARAVLKALEARRPKPHYIVGLDAWGLEALRRITSTRRLDRILARFAGILVGKNRVDQERNGRK